MTLASNRGAPGQRPKNTKPKFGEGPRKPLRVRRIARHVGRADYLRMLGAAKAEQGGRCIGHIAGIEHECEEPFDALHLVDQQAIVRRHGEGHEALADERLVAYGCRWVHDGLDDWRGDLKDPSVRNRIRAAAHPEFEVALQEHDLTREADRKFDGA